MIQSFFGGIGSVTIQQKKNSARYSIVSLKEIVNIILPHFSNFPLQSAKKTDYQLWKNCINIMENNLHLTFNGVQQILAYKEIMNWGLSSK